MARAIAQPKQPQRFAILRHRRTQNQESPHTRITVIGMAFRRRAFGSAPHSAAVPVCHSALRTPHSALMRLWTLDFGPQASRASPAHPRSQPIKNIEDIAFTPPDQGLLTRLRPDTENHRFATGTSTLRLRINLRSAYRITNAYDRHCDSTKNSARSHTKMTRHSHDTLLTRRTILGGAAALAAHAKMAQMSPRAINRPVMCRFLVGFGNPSVSRLTNHW
jgi:hypothetical protein